MDLTLVLQNPKLAKWINPMYLTQANLDNLKKQFSEAHPFPHLVLTDFLGEEQALLLLDELANEQFEIKEADLFRFMQTNDLAGSSSTVIQEFRDIMRSPDFVAIMSYVTGIDLKKDVVDMHGTLYQDTDYLLCHDDQLDERKIAFLLYLSEMEDDEGGSLNLFENDGRNPSAIAKKLVPKFNTFTFFAVSALSFHEVEEVVVDKQRVAIGGWLHG